MDGSHIIRRSVSGNSRARGRGGGLGATALPWGARSGRVNRRLLIGLALVLLGGLVVAVLARPSVSTPVVTAVDPADFVNGRFRKGARIRVETVITDSDDDPEPKSRLDVLNSLSEIWANLEEPNGEEPNGNEPNGDDGAPLANGRLYWWNENAPGSITHPATGGHDNFTLRVTSQGSHTDDGEDSNECPFPVGFTPVVRDVQVNPVIGTQDSVYEFFIRISDEDGERLLDGYPKLYVRKQWDQG